MSDLRGLSGHQGGSTKEGEPLEHTKTWTPLAVSESVNWGWPQPKPAQTANFNIGFQEFVSHKSARCPLHTISWVDVPQWLRGGVREDYILLAG